MKLPIKGYTALTAMISGDELVWSVEDEGQLWPDIYNTEKDVWKSIADDKIQQLQQFIDDKREVDEVDWDLQETVVQIEIDEEGNIQLWDTGNTFNNLITEVTLEEWRKGL